MFCDKSLPAFSIPGFDSIVLHMLASIQPFHRQRMIKFDWRWESDFQLSMMSTGRRQPESGGITIQRGFLAAATRHVLGDEIVPILLPNSYTELLQALHVGFGQQSAAIWRQPQHQLPTPPDCLFVYGNKFVQRLQRGFITGCQNQRSLRNGVSASTERQRR